MDNSALSNKPFLEKIFYKKHLFLYLCFICAFWLLLFFRGYPDPNQDDLFFIGQAISLANDGDFVNPLLESWNQYFSSGKYFYHLPYYSFILAAWLKVFGVSAKSFSLFQMVNAIIFSTSVLILLREFKLKSYLCFPIIILYALWMNQYGLRPDSTGMTLLSLGLVCLTKDKVLYYFAGIFLSIASFLSSTLVLAAYAIPFSVGIIIINYSRIPSHFNRVKYIKWRLLAFILAILANSLIFLMMIQFKLGDWLTDFLLTVSMRRASTLQNFPLFLKLITQYWNPVVLIPSYILLIALVVGFFSTFSKRSVLSRILVIALISGIFLNICIYPNASGHANFFVMAGILCLSSSASFTVNRINLIFLFSIGILLSSQLTIILALTQRDYPHDTYFRDVKAKISEMPEPRKYAIDSVAAKYLFNYNFPKNTISWEFIKVNAVPHANDKKENETWIVSKSNLGAKVKELGIDYPVVQLFNRKLYSIPKNPYELLILP